MPNTLREKLAEQIYLSFVESSEVTHPVQKYWDALGGKSDTGLVMIGDDVDELFRNAIDYTLQESENMGHIFTEEDLNG